MPQDIAALVKVGKDALTAGRIWHKIRIPALPPDHEEGMVNRMNTWVKTLTAALLIAATTFVICMIGLVFGKKFGERLADKATVIGGLILIAIGIEIFVKGVFFS